MVRNTGRSVRCRLALEYLAKHMQGCQHVARGMGEVVLQWCAMLIHAKPVARYAISARGWKRAKFAARYGWSVAFCRANVDCGACSASFLPSLLPSLARSLFFFFHGRFVILVLIVLCGVVVSLRRHTQREEWVKL